jgi:hypothetical protein
MFPVLLHLVPFFLLSESMRLSDGGIEILILSAWRKPTGKHKCKLTIKAFQNKNSSQLAAQKGYF